MTSSISDNASTRVSRQAALDRLSSTEQLDRLIVLVRPSDWAALFVLFVFVGVAVAWSILGSVPTRVKGSGMLVSKGGRLYTASASAEGTLTELAVTVGQQVQVGQLLARIRQPEVGRNLENARAQVADQRDLVNQVRNQSQSSAAARLANRQSRLTAFEEARVNAEARAKSLEDRVKNEEYLLERGFSTQTRVLEARRELSIARQAANDARSQIVNLEAEEVTARNREERDVRDAEGKLADAERRVRELETQLENRQQVLSPAEGRVTELKTAPGTRVTAAMPLVTIESGATGLQLLLYIPPEHGKEVTPGMDVRIAPSIVKVEEFGTLLGKVVEVSDFPSTPQAMQSTLQNERLVQHFQQGGAPFAARIDLTLDADTVSGYRWSAGGGAPIKLSSGTLAVGEVLVRRQAPITFVIPLLRKAIGL